MQFNPDGSLKIGGSAGRKQEEETRKMRDTRCVRITRDATKTDSPKQCTLHLEASPHLEAGYIERAFGLFSKRIESTMLIRHVSDKEFQIVVGGEFSRCRDCNYFVSAMREGLFGNVIEKKGTCTFKRAEYM